MPKRIFIPLALVLTLALEACANVDYASEGGAAAPVLPTEAPVPPTESPASGATVTPAGGNDAPETAPDNPSNPPADSTAPFDETLERYYDYIQNNPQVYMLMSDYAAGFTDNNIAGFSIIYLNNSPDYDGDYAGGFAPEDFDAVTEKFFGRKVGYDHRLTQINADTGKVVPTGWDFSRPYMVLKNLDEGADGVKTATFYTLFDWSYGEWPDADKIKNDLLSGRFYGYGAVHQCELTFIEKYDENGEMYFYFIAVNESADESVTVWEESDPDGVAAVYGG
jgi:hypothetical protein